MIWDTIFFIILPYISLAVAIVVSIYRSIYRPFSVSSYSSQLLERKKLYWGSISFHYGIVLILLGHLFALLLPKGLILWNSLPIRMYVLELTGISLGIWSLAGIFVLLWRHLSEKRVQAVTTPMDFVVLVLVLLSVLTGLWTATFYRFGTSWFTVIFTPYLLSILKFQPMTNLLASLPWIVKLHVINFFILLAVFPFSRLIHIAAYPLGYLIRPWLVVISNRMDRKASKYLRSSGK